MEPEGTFQANEAQRRRAPRSGPVGRMARLLLATVLAFVAFDLWTDRAEVFAASDPLDEPFLWVLAALVVFGVYSLADGAAWGKRTIGVLALLAIAAAGVTVATEGTPWTQPLTWLVWGLGLGGLVSIVLLLLVAVIVGTPGCEVGVVREVVARRRGESDDLPMFCLGGLHSIDAWERRRSWHRTD